jgi:superfamily I DNA and/or RNA helicase
MTNEDIASLDDVHDRHRLHIRRPLLVCAPSNAAIDEIVKRLCTRADMKDVRIVRLGNPESVHNLVKNISLDVQAEEELERITNPPVIPMKRYGKEKKYYDRIHV